MASKKTEIKGLFDSQFFKELESSSHRATAIVGASIIERMLEQLLEAYLVKNKSILKEFITGPNAPLGTFSSKIKACYLLGLFSIKTFQDLEKVRLIRNKFAHELYYCDFETEDIKSLIYSFNYGPKMFIYRDGKSPSVRLLFMMELMVINITITRKLTRIVQLKEVDSEDDDWKLEKIDYDWIHNRKEE